MTMDDSHEPKRNDAEEPTTDVAHDAAVDGDVADATDASETATADASDAAEEAAEETAAEPPARTDTVTVPATTGPVTTAARAQVREKALQVKARQKRNRIIFLSSVGIVLVAIIATIAVLVTNTVSTVVNKPEVSPAGIVDGGIQVTASGVSIPSGAGNGTVTGTTTPAPVPSVEQTAPANPVKVRVYLDYLSPDSATFQKANAKQLARLVGAGSVTLTYHPVATMTSKSNGSKYSLRASGAAACVASFAPDHFYAFTYELLAKQPAADAPGMTDDELASLATAVGAGSSEGLRLCMKQGTYEPWVKTSTEAALNSNLPGTEKPLSEVPTILVNGVPYIGALDDPAEFMQFIMAAESKVYYDTSPSPTPTPTTTSAPTPSESASAG